MKNTFYKLLGMALVVLLMTAGAAGAAYIDLRVDGISAAYDGAPFDPLDGELTLEVWIMPEDNDIWLENYAFNVSFDTSETIDYTGGVESRPSGWFPLSDPTLVDMGTYVKFIEGFTFSSYVKLAGGVHVADLYFSFDENALTEDLSADFAVYYQLGQGMTIDAVVVTPGSVSQDLVGSAVPIPAAAWLLGSGLIGLVGLRRRNS